MGDIVSLGEGVRSGTSTVKLLPGLPVLVRAAAPAAVLDDGAEFAVSREGVVVDVDVSDAIAFTVSDEGNSSLGDVTISLVSVNTLAGEVVVET